MLFCLRLKCYPPQDNHLRLLGEAKVSKKFSRTAGIHLSRHSNRDTIPSPLPSIPYPRRPTFHSQTASRKSSLTATHRLPLLVLRIPLTITLCFELLVCSRSVTFKTSWLWPTVTNTYFTLHLSTPPSPSLTHTKQCTHILLNKVSCTDIYPYFVWCTLTSLFYCT